MDTLNNLLAGFQTAMLPVTLMYCFIGVFLGTLIGVLPGVGSLAAISLLLPVTYYIEPTPAIIMLAGVYYGAQYGGSTASILLNLPGSASSAITCLDGHPMAQQGRAGAALFMTAAASFFGSMIGLALLVAFAPAIAELGLELGSAEYFALMALGLVAASTLGSGALAKGLAMVLLGLLLGVVGTDVSTGVQRFTFGFNGLAEGLSIVALAMGVFGIAEVIGAVNRPREGQLHKDRISLRSMVPSRDDVRRSWMPMARGSGIGSFFGALPGTGAAIAAFIAYAVEKKVAREPARFGKGAVEGITAPESANNAAAQTAFVPTLTLGIPGDAVMALMLGALILHGITPGPLLMVEQPELFWGLIASFVIGNLMLLVLNIPLIGLWVSVLRIPYSVLYPAIIVFICLGVYSVNNSSFDILQVALIGALGYAFAVLSFEPAPLLLGFILGPLMEEHFRRAMMLARGDVTTFVDRPLSAIILGVTVAVLAWAVCRRTAAVLKRREALRMAG